MTDALAKPRKNRREAERVAAKDPRRFLCTFAVGDLCCPLPGVYAKGGAEGRAAPRDWRCWLHLDAKPWERDAESKLREVIERQHELIAERYGIDTRGTGAIVGVSGRK